MDFDKVSDIAKEYLERGLPPHFIAVEGSEQSFVASLIAIPDTLQECQELFWQLGNQMNQLERLGDLNQIFMVIQATVSASEFAGYEGKQMIVMTRIDTNHNVEYRLYELDRVNTYPFLTEAHLYTEEQQKAIRLPLLQAFIEGYHHSQAQWN